MKSSFILYSAQYEALQGLTTTQKGILFDALFRYVIDEKVPEIKDNVVKMAFGFIRLQIDMDSKKYEDKRERNRENIRKRWAKKNGTADGDTTEYDRIRPNTTEYDGKFGIHNDNDNDNDNDNESTIVDNNKNNKKENKKNIFDDEFIRKNYGIKQGYTPPTAKESEHFIGLMKDFARIVKDTASFIKAPRLLTPHRVELFRSVCLDFNDDQIRSCFAKMGQSAYLNGKTKSRTRPADFDWLMQYNNFVKIFDGSL
jgi:hypothetical protein